MILQELTKYYETLAEKGKVSRPGWCTAKISFALDLGEDGTLKEIIPLKEEKKMGKKTVTVPQERIVPQMVSRSSGVSANFLCDNSKYLLGIDGEGYAGRVAECFDAARKKHLQILENADGRMVRAVRNFFRIWKPEEAKENSAIQNVWEELTGGGNLIFVMGMDEAQEDPDMREAWEQYRAQGEPKQEGICLVTGKKADISRIHTAIKGVQGAQSSGAALVSFNAPAFESYGKEQSFNAPVGKYAAFAYTTALNYLLSQKKYVFRLGDTTIVFWAESGDEWYQDAFMGSMEPGVDNQEMLRDVFDRLGKQKSMDANEIQFNPEQRFYILGLAPNAARLSVRFFYQDRFGNIINNIRKHYERMRILRRTKETEVYMGVWRLLQETVNKNSTDKNPAPNLPAGVMRAILSDGRYPQELYSSLLIRIRAEQGEVSWRRAAIIKAFLIKNYHMQKGDEFVALNEETREAPYILGRIFAVLESIQEEANPGINATIRDRYFNAACASPASIFPILMKLKNSHVRKLDDRKKGLKVYFETTLTRLMGKLDEYPKRLNLEEQGRFILGYYHQMEKRFEKKEDKENE